MLVFSHEYCVYKQDWNGNEWTNQISSSLLEAKKIRLVEWVDYEGKSGNLDLKNFFILVFSTCS